MFINVLSSLFESLKALYNYISSHYYCYYEAADLEMKRYKYQLSLLYYCSIICIICVVLLLLFLLLLFLHKAVDVGWLLDFNVP